MKKKNTEVPIQINDIDGIGQFALVLKHGVTELWGGNGERKTRVQAGILDATSRKRDVEIGISDAKRDGKDALLGSVSVAGRTLQISRSGAVQRSGKLLTPLQIVDPSPIGRLIDPGHVAEEAKRKAQLRAFLELVPLKAKREYLKSITGGDKAVLSQLEADLEERSVDDLLVATKRMRTMVMKEANRLEALTEDADDDILGTDGILEDLTNEGMRVSELGKRKLQRALSTPIDEEAIENLELERRQKDRLAGEVSARRDEYLEAVAKQEKLKNEIGKRPKTSTKKMDLHKVELVKIADKIEVTKEAIEKLEDSVLELKRGLFAQETKEDHQQEMLNTERIAWEATVETQEQWDKASAFLNEELVEVGADHVDIAMHEAAAADVAVKMGNLSTRYGKALERRVLQVRSRSKSQKRAEVLREIEHEAWTRLGELVTRESRIPEITISQGWLAYVDPETKEVHDWNSKYVSDGQRCGAAMRLGARCARSVTSGNVDPILMIPGRIWEGAFDLQMKLQVAEICRVEKVFGITEVASFQNHGLHSVEVGTVAWVGQYRELLKAAEKAIS